MPGLCEVVVPVACEAVGSGPEPLQSGSIRWRVCEVAHTPEWIHSRTLVVPGDSQKGLNVVET